MRTFVTGAGGFLGSHLVARLLVHGDAVAGTYPSGMAAPAGVEAYELDILDTAALHRAFHHFEPEIVVHLAGLAHVGASWQHREEYFRVNVEGTERLVEAAAGRPVVLASSAEVYGPVPEAEQPIEESRPLAPASPYAETKVAAEERVLAAGGRALRTFNLIGPGQSPSFALPSFARQLAAIARGEAPPVLRVGNLSARRDFVHVADGVEAYRLVAERGEAGGVYNLASGEDCSIEEALAELIALAGVPAEIEIDPERFRPADVPLLVGNPARLEALGWQRSRSRRQALEELWRSVVGEVG